MIKICRIATFNNAGLIWMEEHYGVNNFLDVLEKSQGGHGNGVVFINDNKISFTKKGVKYSNYEILTDVNRINPDWMLYHTRIRSAGTVKDSNCHPFVNAKQTFAMIMNGTIPGYSTIGNALDITDTELFFKNVRDYHIPLETLVDLTPKFMGFKDGKVWATNPDSFSLKFIHEGDAIIIASEFPTELREFQKSLEKGYWDETMELKEHTVAVSTYYSGRGYKTYLDDNYVGWWNKDEKKDSKKNKKEEEYDPKHFDIYPQFITINKIDYLFESEDNYFVRYASIDGDVVRYGKFTHMYQSVKEDESIIQKIAATKVIEEY